MIKKYNLILILILLISMLVSCSKESKTESLIEEKLETMSGKEMLRELLIKNDNDFDQLARIFDCSPSSLKRILAGETHTTDEGKNQFRNVLNQTLITKESTLDELDPKYQPWKLKMKHLIETNYIKIGLTVIAIILVGFIFPSTSTDEVAFEFFGIMQNDKSYPLVGIGLLLLLITLLFYFILVVIGWFTIETIHIDKFKNTFDPIWEISK
jgi:hypothetical protein